MITFAKRCEELTEEARQEAELSGLEFWEISGREEDAWVALMSPTFPLHSWIDVNQVIISMVHPTFRTPDDPWADYMMPDWQRSDRIKRKLIPPLSNIQDGDKWLPISAKSYARQFRRLLLSGRLKTHLRSIRGPILPVPPEYWNSDDAGNVLWREVQASVTINESTMECYIIVSVEELEAFLHPAKPNPFSESSIAPSYVPPYLEFMLRAVSALGLAPDKRLGKKVITDWLRDNWDTHRLGEAAEVKIAKMATFLRDPDQQRGGLYSSSDAGSTRSNTQRISQRAKRRDRDKG